MKDYEETGTIRSASPAELNVLKQREGMKDLASEMKKLEAAGGDPDRQARIFAGVPNQDDLKWMTRQALQESLQDFIREEANLTKTIAQNGKKDLAREILHLRGVIKTIRDATKRVEPLASGGRTFQHAEAFRLMTYREVNLPSPANRKHVTPANAREIRIWNSRDGVTPFIVHIGLIAYEHVVQGMQGPFYDLPEAATHKWVSRTDREVQAAWNRTLDRAVRIGKLTAEKADAQRNNLDAARSWNYQIGLVDLSTGKYTDEQLEELTDGVALASDSE